MEHQEKLRTYLDRAFSTAPDSAAVREAKAEIYSDLTEKYQALLESGHSPESAYHATIAGIGDIFQLVDSMGGASAAQAQPITAQKVPAQPAAPGSSARPRKVLLPLLAGGAVLLLLLLDLFNPPGPKSALRYAPLLLAGLFALLVLVYVLRNRPAAPAASGALWYRVLIAGIWLLALLLCVFFGTKPHLRRLIWFVLLIALALHGVVRNALVLRGGDEHID